MFLQFLSLMINFIGLYLLYRLFYTTFVKAFAWYEVHQQLRSIPGPTLKEERQFICKVILGNRKNCPKEIKNFFTESAQKYGQKYGLFAINSLVPAIFVCEAALAREVLGNEQFQNMTLLHNWIATMATGNGLLTCNYEQSKKCKTIFKNHFNFPSIEKYISQSEKHFERFSQKVKKEFIANSGGLAVDVMTSISNLNLDIIAETLFGTKFNAQHLPHEHLLVQRLHSFLGHVDQLIFQPWKYTTPSAIGKMLLLFFDVKLFSEVVPFVRDLILFRWSLCQLIIHRLKTGTTETGHLLIDSAIQSANLEKGPLFPFNWRRILEAQGHIMTFILTAHDSTTTTISWLLYQLVHHPKVQRKLQNEIDAFLATHGQPGDLFALNRLPYLDCCLMETLRLSPIASYSSRLSDQPFSLPSRGLHFPANVPVVVDFQFMHYDEQNFGQADKFIPERFLSFDELMTMGEDKASPPYANKTAFFPWGYGMRGCFGQRYGQMVVKLFCFHLLRQFNLQPVDSAAKFHPVHSIFQKAAHFPVHFAKRSNV